MHVPYPDNEMLKEAIWSNISILLYVQVAELFERPSYRQYSTAEHTKSLQKNVFINDQLLSHFQVCLHVTETIYNYTVSTVGCPDMNGSDLDCLTCSYNSFSYNKMVS